MPATSIIEGAGDGTDLVKSGISYTLGASVENLILTGATAIDGAGNGLANTITGNGAANTLSGGGGGDTLGGGLGGDKLYGGAGNDSLTGGGGNRRLLFRHRRSTPSTNVDQILDLFGGQRHDLCSTTRSSAASPPARWPAGAFRNGTAALDADDRILYDAATGQIRYDADGIGGAAAILFATVTAGTALTNADFFAFT